MNYALNQARIISLVWGEIALEDLLVIQRMRFMRKFYGENRSLLSSQGLRLHIQKNKASITHRNTLVDVKVIYGLQNCG